MKTEEIEEFKIREYVGIFYVYRRNVEMRGIFKKKSITNYTRINVMGEPTDLYGIIPIHPGFNSLKEAREFIKAIKGGWIEHSIEE